MTGPATRLILGAPLAVPPPPAPPGFVPTSARRLLDADDWAALPAALAAEPELDLLAMWAEPGLVHAAFRAGTGVLIATGAAPDGRYPALSPARPAAAWFERAVADLWGLVAEGGTDSRPWLDHGHWPLAAPLSARPAAHQPGEPPRPAFLPVEGEGVHQIPLGPLLPEGGPAHLRCHVLGETVLRLEARLGYGHKGVLGMMRGQPPRAAARFVARLSAESTVAHAWAFALAAEAATATPAPPRAALLRAVMAECERITGHLADWGATCAAAGFAWAGFRCGLLRETMLRAHDQAFGHRLLMDRVVPGGVSIDIASSGPDAILEALAQVEQELPSLQAAYDDHASLQDRLAGIGPVPWRLVAALAAGGIAGRASGRGFDTRRDMPYAPYDALGLNVPMPSAPMPAASMPGQPAPRHARGPDGPGRDMPAPGEPGPGGALHGRTSPGGASYDGISSGGASSGRPGTGGLLVPRGRPRLAGLAGDADARMRLRLLEALESLGLIRAALARLEPGPTLVPLATRAGEGVGMVESARGEILHWVALDRGGLVRACFPRDPAWLHWPLLEAAMQGQPVSDLEVCRASLNPSAAGVDL